MDVRFTESASKDFRYWKRRELRIAKRIEQLCKAIQCNPFEGIGKPEPLKFDLEKCWSRRIDRIHRLVYRVERNAIIVISCRYHY